MKKIYFLFLLLIAGTVSYGQVLYEDFNYTVPGNVGGNSTATSDAVGANNWATHSNTLNNSGKIDLVTGSLSYTGLLASTGNKILLPGDNVTVPRDINRALPTPSTGNVQYFSLLINVIDNTQISATASSNGYFMSFGASAGTSVTSLGARLGIISTNSGANFRFNISNISTGTITYTDNGTDLSFGTTYFLVVKYDRFTSPTVATLWVNPTPGETESVSTITNSSGTSTFTSFTSITLRNSSATPKAHIDEIRVGETWASVTPVEPTAGIGKDDITGFSLYPNPVKGGKVFISSANNYAERSIAVFDVLGKQVVSQNGTQNSIDVSHLNKGVYIIKVAEDGKVATRKLVIE